MTPSNWIYVPFMCQSQTKADIQYPRNRRVKDCPPVTPLLLELRRHLVRPETCEGIIIIADYRRGGPRDEGERLRWGTCSSLIISGISIRIMFDYIIDIC